MSYGKVSWLFAVVGFIALLAFGLTRDPDELPSPLVGRAAPDFRLETLNGGADSVRFADLEGTPVVVNFWASWCTACIYEHPALTRAWRRWDRTGEIELLGIVYQDSPAGARRFLRRYGGGWSQLLDPGSRTAIEFGVYGVPETYFIGADGIVAHRHVGPVTDSVLSREVGRLLAEADSLASRSGGAGAPDPKSGDPGATDGGRP